MIVDASTAGPVPLGRHGIPSDITKEVICPKQGHIVRYSHTVVIVAFHFLVYDKPTLDRFYGLIINVQRPTLTEGPNLRDLQKINI